VHAEVLSNYPGASIIEGIYILISTFLVTRMLHVLFCPEKQVLDELSEEDQCRLLETLPTDLPLALTVPLLKDGIYWKRSSQNRWQSVSFYVVATDSITNKVLEPITFVLAYPTVYENLHNKSCLSYMAHCFFQWFNTESEYNYSMNSHYNIQGYKSNKFFI